MSDAVLETGRGAAPLAAPSGSDLSEVRDWITLLKPRVVSLVVLTGIIGLVVAPGPIHPVLAIAAVLCIGLAAGAAGAINMWYDRDIDALMRRTATRPIPAGRIAPDAALGYGIILSLTSVGIMGLATNWVAAAVLALSIAFYVGVYTIWLKRRTPQNIVIGGAAGAFPPVIGWAAVTGDVTLVPLILFAIIFLWTPPHFWALSLWAHGDYARARVPMLPVTHGARETRRQVLLYTAALVPVTLLPCAVGFASWIYGVAALLLGAEYLRLNWLVWTDAQDGEGRSLSGDRPARRAFRFSLLYLALIFLALALDRLVLA
jgi:protoheme IX farnesyltransferase